MSAISQPANIPRRIVRPNPPRSEWRDISANDCVICGEKRAVCARIAANRKAPNETHEKREPSNRRRLSSLLVRRGRTQLPALYVLSGAGVMGKDLAEVLVCIDRGVSTIEVAPALERAVFLVLVEVIRVSRNVVA